jgi:hypothetical protein
MACTITVFQPTGEEGNAGQGLIRLTISGTAVDCSQVRVRVQQTQPSNFFTPQKTVPVVNGQWSVDFTDAAGDFPLGTFRCGRDNKYTLHVECVDHPDCPVQSQADGATINCDNCPQVNMTITPGECANGLRNVHILAEVVSTGNAVYTWYFGTDEDNQPGEDNQFGGWLPAPNANGISVVETNHLYALFGDEPQTVTVRIETSSGPGSECITNQSFVLEPCTCNLTVSLEITDAENNRPPDGDCLSPGMYKVKIANPPASGAVYMWFVNGVQDTSQSGPVYNVPLAAGEEKSVGVVMTRGGCSALDNVDLTGCLDCQDFRTGLRIFTERRVDVTDQDCLETGSYIAVASPSGQGYAYNWFVNGVQDTTQTGHLYSFTISAGEEKKILVQVSQGDCRGERERVVHGCEDCSDFAADLQVWNASRRNVTDEDCLPAGEYTVQANSPTDPGASLEWRVNNEVLVGETGSSIQVTVSEDNSPIVTLKATQGNCEDIHTVALTTCPPPRDNDGFIPCILFKLLALVGLGFAIVGAILLACPLVAQPIPVQIAMGIGGVLLVAGVALLALGLLLWWLICRPDRCEWITLLWQALILLGLILVYAGFCPACSWMSLGAIFLFLGILGLLYWRRNCNPTVCKVLAELITLFLFAVNITAALAIGLFWCAITSNPVLGVIWGLAIAGIQAWLWYRANQAGCINS